MKKELSPTHEAVACDVCGRTILKGERAEPYLVPDGSRRLVCDLCTRRAEGAGWIRETAQVDMPAAFPRAEPRRSLLGRLRRRLGDTNGPGAAASVEDEPLEDAYGTPAGGEHDEDPLEAEEGLTVTASPEEFGPEELYPEAFLEGGVEEAPVDAPRAPESRALEPRAAESPPEYARRDRRSRRRLRDPRHVRAVPTGAEAKVERALEIFNASEYRRTVAGLVRTLGEPWVTALPRLEATGEVAVVVAWELSWYQYRVDLGDSDEPVTLVRKGQEIDELDAPLRQWNSSAGPDGALESGAPRA